MKQLQKKLNKINFVFIFLFTGYLFGELSETDTVVVIKAHSTKVISVKGLMRGNNFISAEASGKITIWNKKNNNKIKKLASCKSSIEIKAIVISPDERTLAVTGEDEIRTYSLPQLKPAGEAKLETTAELMVFSGDSRAIAVTGADGKIYFFSAKDLKLKEKVNAGGRITSIAFSPDNLKFITGSENGIVTLWSCFSYRPVKKILLGETPRALYYSSNGEFIISIGTDYRIRNMRASTLEISKKVFDMPENTEYFEMVENDKLVFIYCADGTLEFMSPSKGIYASESYQMETGFSAIALFPDGKYILAGDYEGQIKIFRNPLLVMKYNTAVKKGDEAMNLEKYSLALSAYKTAMGLFPEKEAEEKLKQAQKGKEIRDKKRLQKIRKARGKWKR
ncbi:MAG: WD40 repeat domain-containing protein [Elusimicrobia bacterium]|nr:WD40 repeat domain-containing protein [Elusimicrobiota bacterium]